MSVGFSVKSHGQVGARAVSTQIEIFSLRAGPLGNCPCRKAQEEIR